MHLIFNAGKGDKAHGICELIVRGKGLRINQGEKALWNQNVNVFWQEKAWVDSKVMRELAHSFVYSQDLSSWRQMGQLFFVTI